MNESNEAILALCQGACARHTSSNLELVVV